MGEEQLAVDQALARRLEAEDLQETGHRSEEAVLPEGYGSEVSGAQDQTSSLGQRNASMLQLIRPLLQVTESQQRSSELRSRRSRALSPQRGFISSLPANSLIQTGESRSPTYRLQSLRDRSA